MEYLNFINEVFKLFSLYFNDIKNRKKIEVKIQELIDNVKNEGLTDLSSDYIYDQIILLFDYFNKMHLTSNRLKRALYEKKGKTILNNINKYLDNAGFPNKEIKIQD